MHLRHLLLLLLLPVPLLAALLFGACKSADIAEPIACPTLGPDRLPRHPLPDAFSPDGSGLNDVLRPFEDTVGLETMELRVYNEFGDQIASVTDPKGYWDGTDSDTRAKSAPGKYRVAYYLVYRNAKTASGELWVTLYGMSAERCLIQQGCDYRDQTFSDQMSPDRKRYSTAETFCP